MTKNPNWEMSPKDIQRVMNDLDDCKDRYEAWAILATDDTIDKNHALNWMVGYLDHHYKIGNKPKK